MGQAQHPDANRGIHCACKGTEVVRILGVAVVGVAALVILPLAGQVGSNQEESTYEIHVPLNIPLDKFQVTSFVTGPFGAYGWPPRADAAKHSYVIDTTVEHQEAEKLLAILYAPGCQVETVDDPELAISARKVEFVCRDLPTLSFTGIIVLSKKLRTRPYEVEVRYLPVWSCIFFNTPDCMLRGFPMGSVEPDQSGVFHIILPDFTKDPVTQSYKLQASFQFLAREKKSGNILALLIPSKPVAGRIFPQLPLAPNFPHQEVFQAVDE
jgi:hypothetical protein